MEEVLNKIFEEIKGVKDEVKNVKAGLREEVQGMKQELRNEMQEMKQELRNEMQGMKQELRNEMQEMKQEIFNEMDQKMDEKLDKQSKEIAQEFHNVIAYIEEKNRKQEKVNNEILNELKRNRIEHKEMDLRISKLELKQNNVA